MCTNNDWPWVAVLPLWPLPTHLLTPSLLTLSLFSHSLSLFSHSPTHPLSLSLSLSRSFLSHSTRTLFAPPLTHSRSLSQSTCLSHTLHSLSLTHSLTHSLTLSLSLCPSLLALVALCAREITSCGR